MRIYVCLYMCINMHKWTDKPIFLKRLSINGEEKWNKVERIGAKLCL